MIKDTRRTMIVSRRIRASQNNSTFYQETSSPKRKNKISRRIHLRFFIFARHLPQRWNAEIWRAKLNLQKLSRTDFLFKISVHDLQKRLNDRRKEERRHRRRYRSSSILRLWRGSIEKRQRGRERMKRTRKSKGTKVSNRNGERLNNYIENIDPLFPISIEDLPRG